MSEPMTPTPASPAPPATGDVAREFQEAAERSARRVMSFSICSVPGYSKAILAAHAHLQTRLARAEEQLRWRDAKDLPLDGQWVEVAERDVKLPHGRHILSASIARETPERIAGWRPVTPAPEPRP